MGGGGYAGVFPLETLLSQFILCALSDHRHSRAFLHALLHSDNTAALHHLTVHNIAYQVHPGVGLGS